MAIDVRDRMRSDILSARLIPGQRLMFADLSERYGVSVGVTREALTWLSSQGLVQANAHQGYIVTPLSIPDLTELTETRILIEPLVLRMSFETGGMDWEGDVISAHHILSRTPPPHGPKALDEDALDQWAEVHSAFHEVLFAACTNKRLLRTVKQLAEEAAMYRRWSVALVLSNPQAENEHRALLEAALDGDWERGGAVLRTHIEHTREMLTNYQAAHPDE
ncbi:GntR family transcriptional regulator [Lacisediminihabitans profunda]|uniref:FCD domain-containing protein n=1 Tax=Lacisediminihabitans profunda TaxID=2594790 RepID=A0A5C8USN7_9MICO|nr:FCD domain-containing protein [Lacisediminihabitans profunda]TXN30943.1 FCD domain-containing protein [Lacisediminihabitans profunda]